MEGGIVDDFVLFSVWEEKKENGNITCEALIPVTKTENLTC